MSISVTEPGSTGKKNRRKRIPGLILAALMAALTLAGCSGEKEAEEKVVISEWSDFAGLKVGAINDTLHGELLEETFPDSEAVYLNTVIDGVEALRSGTIDAYFADRMVMSPYFEVYDDLAYFVEPAFSVGYGFAFPKNEEGEKLRDQFNEYQGRLQKSGELNAILIKWFALSQDSEAETFDFDSLPAENGVIRYGTDSTGFPACFVYSGELTGYELELLYGFCKEYGYGFESSITTFASLLTGLGEKYDCIGDMICITEERKEVVYFSDPYMESDSIVMIRKENCVNNDLEYASIPELEGKRIGSYKTSLFQTLLENDIELIGSEFYYSDDSEEMIRMLREGELDAILLDSPVAEGYTYQNEELGYICESLMSEDIGFGFREGSSLKSEFDETIQTLSDAGILSELYDKWIHDSDNASLPEQTWAGKNGTLVCWCDPDNVYMCYQDEDGKWAGYELEVLLKCAELLDYRIQFEETDSDGRISGLTSGLADITAGALTITEERDEKIDFSIPTHQAEVVFVVRKGTGESEQISVFESIKKSFVKTFIRENRYKLFLEGIGTTLLITLASLILGSIAGFILYLLYRLKFKPFMWFADTFSQLFSMTPMVMILMVMYYVIFSKSKASGELISVIAFSISFMNSVFGMIKMGMSAVDPGQTEAGLALGFSPFMTFIRIIFPQAAVNFMPAYLSETIALIKGTSVVGYVAVQDMTKMSDIIRSRTFEAFFPLVATAILYIVLAWLLTLLVKLLARKIDLRTRSKEKIGKELGL